MQTIELFQLTCWLRSNIIDTQLQNKYQQLINVIERNTQANQSKTPFNTQLDDLKELLSCINIYELSYEQQDLVEKFGMMNSLGTKAIIIIDDAAYKNALDLANLKSIIQNLYNDMNVGLNKINKIYEALKQIYNEEETYIENRYEAIMKVKFIGGASMNNINDMKALSSQWHDIIRGICLVHDEAPESMDIIGTEKGSIIIVFGSGALLIKTLSGIMLKVLECIEKVYSIKKQAQEVQQLKLENDEIEKRLLEEAEKVKENQIESIMNATKSELKLSDGEKANALRKSIQQLSRFMEKDGEVDCHIPQIESIDDEEEQKNEELLTTANLITENFKKIRKLENDIKLLETTQKVG